MDSNAFLNLLFSTQAAVLPSAVALRLLVPLAWAVVLGSATLTLTTKLTRPYRLGWTGLVIVWTLLPGRVSPTYWLGLAFQTPSLTSVGLCLFWVWHTGRRSMALRVDPVARSAVATQGLAAWVFPALPAIAWGWVLLLDTFACWPVSIYAWGFSSISLAGVALLAALLWEISAGSRSRQVGPVSAGLLVVPVVLILFVLTRLPTGNLWDALLDPWLWLALQVKALWWLWAARRPLATIRA